MSIKNQIESDMRDAMRARDELRKNTLRMALTNIKLAEVDKGGALDETALLALMQKEIKSRRESIADAERAGRSAFIESLKAEIALLEAYLPKQLAPEELEALVREAIAESGATSQREMGQVMKILVPRLQGRASNNEASQVVRRLLQP